MVGSASLLVTGGSFSGNQARFGGVFAATGTRSGSVVLNGTTALTNNYANVHGGVLFASSSATVELYGATITNATAAVAYKYWSKPPG